MPLHLIVSALAGSSALEAGEAMEELFSGAQLGSWFREMDHDQSGQIDQAELDGFLDDHRDLRHMLRGVTQAGHNRDIMSSMDKDASGSLDSAEFVDYFARLGFVELEQKGDGLWNEAVETGARAEPGVMSEVRRILKSKMEHFPGINSVEEIMAWTPELAGPYQGGPGHEPAKPDRPRSMSIHDMAGGYGKHPDNEYLQLFAPSWNAVDVFVYFSHIRLAVPPPQWTTEAHVHGSLALGTLMLEPGNSEAAEMTENSDAFIDKIVEITDHYGFDGWLVNVEAWGGSGSAEDFVGKLTKKSKAKLGKRSYIVAYPYNPGDEMMDKADGIYVNYGWSTSDSAMEQYKAESHGKQHDVYMGLDAFGSLRGNPTPDKMHVGACAKHDLSVAVFAPGFTFEHQSHNEYSKEAERIDQSFWEDIRQAFHINRAQELGREFPDLVGLPGAAPAAPAKVEKALRPSPRDTKLQAKLEAAEQRVLTVEQEEAAWRAKAEDAERRIASLHSYEKAKGRAHEEKLQGQHEKIADLKESRSDLVSQVRLMEAKRADLKANFDLLQGENERLAQTNQQAEQKIHQADLRIAKLMAEVADEKGNVMHHLSAVHVMTVVVIGMMLFVVGRWVGLRTSAGGKQ